MLNISDNNKNELFSLDKYKTIQFLSRKDDYKMLNRIIMLICFIGIIALFLPWTQNISGDGAVTSLKPNQRPQTIHSTIAGRVEKWYVQEGDLVKEGDTILFISEVKAEYLDPNLVENTKEQADAKEASVTSYQGKMETVASQLVALESEKNLKLSQAKNKIKQSAWKIKSDSTDLEAVKTQLKIARTQFNRSQQLQKDGLKPMTDLEEKRLKLQDVEAKIITQENKFLASKNDLFNAKLEVQRIEAEYSEKKAKMQGEQFSAQSNQLEAKAQASKLKNQYQNYAIRKGMYYIKAPQSGYINRALLTGVGEIIKEGTPVVSIMPLDYQIAVETFVEPADLPLIQKGEKVRVWFDGWPTIVFSGWPNMSIGTFGGKVVAIENFISENGKYRILIAPDPTDKPWPKELGIGSGAETMALLDNVPIWFEIWRTLNGFPPNYYKNNAKEDKSKSKK